MRRRVLFVNTPTYISGAELSLLTLMQHLPPERVQSRLLTGGQGPLLQRARAAGVPTAAQEFAWFSRRRPWNYLRSIAGLVRTIRAQDIDLVHTNCDFSLRYVRLATRLTRTPYVCHVRDTVRSWFAPAHLDALNRAARVIANSSATAHACITAGVDARRVVTVYNPIDIAAFQGLPAGTRERWRTTFGIPADVLVVAIIGQVQPIKGYMEFVTAALTLVEQVPRVHVLLVGDPPPDPEHERFGAEVRARVSSADKADRFHFAGFQSEIASVMQAIDIVAMPSWNEPFGRVAVEGMAAGCAVVATAAGGVPEIITDGVDGLLVAPRDASSLAAALVRLSCEEDLRQRLAKRGELTATRFTVAAHVERMLALYEQVWATREIAA